MTNKSQQTLEIVSFEIWRTSPPPPGGMQPEPTLDDPSEKKSRWVLTSNDSEEFKPLAARVLTESIVFGGEEDMTLTEFMSDESKNSSEPKVPSGGSGHTDVLTLTFNNGKKFEFSGYSEYKIRGDAFTALYDLTMKSGK